MLYAVAVLIALTGPALAREATATWHAWQRSGHP